MQAGQLRHRVTFQRKVVTRDTFNAEVITWADVCTVWAAVEPLTGREFLDARQQSADLSVRIRVRFREDIHPAMRARWGERVFDVDNVMTKQEMRRETHVMCRESVPMPAPEEAA